MSTRLLFSCVRVAEWCLICLQCYRKQLHQGCQMAQPHLEHGEIHTWQMHRQSLQQHPFLPWRVPNLHIQNPMQTRREGGFGHRQRTWNSYQQWRNVVRVTGHRFSSAHTILIAVPHSSHRSPLITSLSHCWNKNLTAATYDHLFFKGWQASIIVLHILCLVI